MPDIIEIAEALVKLNVSTLLFKVLSKPSVQAFIINLNTEDQLKGKNENALGVKLYTIGGEYSIETQFLKRVGPKEINLFDSGDYYETFIVVPQRNGDFDILSDNEIHGSDTILASERWGIVEGLQPSNLVLVKEFIEDQIIQEIESLL